jgi:putative transport protein
MSEVAQNILTVIGVACLGYLLGRIKIWGISLGATGIFIVGLIFGHFGVTTPKVLQNIGLVLFITATGLSAGPGFIQRIKRNGSAYIILCLTTTVVGCILCIAAVKLGHLSAPLAVGIMAGSFTTSPGFAAAQEAVQSNADAVLQVAAGYGLIYPIGVVCTVLFIQIIPRLLRANMAQERKLIEASAPIEEEALKPQKEAFRIDKYGLCIFSIVVVLGVLLGSISIPLPGGGQFALGLTGGPLAVGLVVGHFAHKHPGVLTVDEKLIGPVEEVGLLLFFADAGIDGGHGVAAILAEYGMTPIWYGLIMVLVPLIIGFLTFRFYLKLPLLNGLSALTGSMTSTAALAVLTQIAKTDTIVAAYATTYPLALVLMVLVMQFLIAL